MIDITTAFLHAELPDWMRVFLMPPATEGLAPDQCWRAHRAVYGLRESPRLFQEHFATRVQLHRWRRLVSDPQLFVHEEGWLLSVHTDDILICAPTDKLQEVYQMLAAEFVIKPMSILGADWERYLGREWRRSDDGIEIRIPPKYYQSILQVMNLGEGSAKALSSPMIVEKEQAGDEIPLSAAENHIFRTGVGKLMWLIAERADLAFATKEIARAVSASTQRDLALLKRICRYLIGTTEVTMKLQSDPNEEPDVVKVITDASWGSSRDRKSTSGGGIWWCGVLLAHWSRTQAVVAQSSCEAELLSMAEGGREGRFVQTVLKEIGDVESSLELYTDSASSAAVTMKRGMGRMKHLELRALYLQDEVRAGRLRVLHIGTNDNPADLLTKPLKAERIKWLMGAFGLRDRTPEPHIDEEQLIAAVARPEAREVRRPLLGPRHCRVPMELMIVDGRCYWQCAACAAVETWMAYEARNRLVGGRILVSVQAVAVIELEQEPIQTYVAEAEAVPEPLPEPEQERAEWTAAPDPQLRPHSEGRVVVPVRLSPPTQRQLDYVEGLCRRLGLVYDDEMQNIQTKADASRWLDTHASRR